MELLSALVTVLLLTAVYYHGKALAEKRRGDNFKHQFNREIASKSRLISHSLSAVAKIERALEVAAKQ